MAVAAYEVAVGALEDLAVALHLEADGALELLLVGHGVGESNYIIASTFKKSLLGSGR